MELPSTELINDQRIVKFKQRISDTLATEELGVFYPMVEQFQQEHNVPALQIAAALAHLLQGDEPFLLTNKPTRKASFDRKDDRGSRDSRDRPRRRERERDRDSGRGRDRERSSKRDSGRDRDSKPAEGMSSYRIEVGNNHEVRPGNIVGAIANEANMDSSNIGRIQINDSYSLVDLPSGMPKEVFNDLKKVWVSGQQLKISRVSGDDQPRRAKPSFDEKPRKGKEKLKLKKDEQPKKKKKKKNKDKGKPRSTAKTRAEKK